MLKVLLCVSALIGAALVGYVSSSLQMGSITVAQVKSPIDISYIDMVALTLTAMGIFLALASIGLGVAGIVGWNSIESKAISVAETVTSANLNDENSSMHKLLKAAIADENSALHQTLKAEARKAMFAGVQDVRSDHDELEDVAESAAVAEGGQ